MNPFLQSAEGVEAFLREYSDLYSSQAETTTEPEAQPCKPLTAQVEGSQPESPQSQAVSPGRPAVSTAESSNIPGMALTQNSDPVPDDTLGELGEAGPGNQHIESSDESKAAAGSWATANDTPKAWLTDTNESMVTSSYEGSHMKTLSAAETLEEAHSKGLGGRQMKTRSHNHYGGQLETLEGLCGMTVCGDENPVESHTFTARSDPAFYGGQKTTSNDSHVLYQRQVTMPSYRQTVYGGQMTTSKDSQVLYQRQMTMPGYGQTYRGQMSTSSDSHVLYQRQMTMPGYGQTYRGQMSTSSDSHVLFQRQMTMPGYGQTYGGQMTTSSDSHVLYQRQMTMPGYGQTYGGQMTTSSDSYVLYQRQMTMPGYGQTYGEQMTTSNDSYVLYQRQMTTTSYGQTLYGEEMTTTDGDHTLYRGHERNSDGGQTFYGGHMTTNSGPKLNENQMMTLVSNQPHSWDHTMYPGSSYVSPLAQGQLPSFSMDDYGEHPGKENINTNRKKSQKKSDTSKRYVCTYENCDKSYNKSSHLRVHERIHTGEKPYVCDDKGCPWKFCRSDELKRHKRKHTGERPFLCSKCNKRFARADYLKQHDRSQHWNPSVH